MSRVRNQIAALLVAGLLTACSSTMPQSAALPDALPTVTPGQALTGDGTDSTVVPQTATAAPEVTPLPVDGPVTTSMAKLKLDGERYATLGDPNAPVTVVEFSDYG